MFGVNYAWVFLRLMRARCLRRMALFRSGRISLLTVFGQNMLRDFLVACVNGALIGKMQVATRNPSDNMSCMVSALSNICVLTSLLVVLSSGESVWMGVLSLVRRLERSVCAEVVVAFVAPCVSSAH